MCGIAGVLRAGGLISEDESRLDAMLEAIQHRGPDGRGAHIDRSTGLAMGHTRLSIIDLHTGDQPLHSSQPSLVLTANGEFYDYKPIRADLACRGERFRTKSDSEIALPLYRRHGLDFVHRLRGEFAFALWDAEAQRLVLVRDRFGVKPLYYHATGGALYWGSEIKALLAHPRVPRRLSRRAALHQLMQTMAPGTSAFEDVHALRPGHMLVAQLRGARLETRDLRWWDMDFPREDEREDEGDPARWVEAVREALVDSVRTRLEADVPVACYLSGGIDSCSILGMATAMQQSPVKAFTISFDNEAFDEADIAREMARSVGADQDVLELAAADLYGDHYVQTVWHAERTFYNTLGVAKWHMSRHVRDAGYKVVVTGEGSDELFGGYPFLKRDLFLHGATGEDRRAGMAALERSNELFKGSILSEETASHPAWDALCGFTPSWIQPWILTLARVRPLLAPAVRDELADYDPVAAIAATLDAEALDGRHPLDRAQYTWIKTMLEGQILTWGGDRVDMAHSMESRPAFLDHRVADVARRLPPSVRIRDGVEKWVLREAMKGVLPEVLYKREKFAFMAPPAYTDPAKAKAVHALVERCLSEDAVRDAGLLDPGRVGDFLRRLPGESDPQEATRSDVILNHLLGLQLLHRQFIAGEAPELGAAA